MVSYIWLMKRSSEKTATNSSFGPGPRYSVKGDLEATACSTATEPGGACDGWSPATTQCLQKANLGSSGVGASGSTKSSV